MLSAAVDVVAEHGVADLTVALVVARSGVSRRTFYEIFDDREDCFLAAFDEGVERIAREVAGAYEQSGGWCDRVRAGLVVLLSFLEREPAMGSLLIVESLGAGPRALERRARVLDVLNEAVDEGRIESGSGLIATPLTAAGVVGAVLSVLHERLLAYPPKAAGAGDGGGLMELVNPLMSMIVLPYLGAPAARRELQRPVPKHRDRPEHGASGDMLRDLQMRLTYRTVRVLIAVAANPGSSNRTIAEGSGITDQGQISKLLGRLHHLGLIENTGPGPARGEPNAWTLTAKGWQVHTAISAQASSA
jgi:AcrR family transcriptional regulator